MGIEPATPRPQFQSHAQKLNKILKFIQVQCNVLFYQFLVLKEMSTMRDKGL